MQNSPETYHGNEHKTDSLSEAAGERLETLKSIEASAELSPDQKAEKLEAGRNEVKEVFAQESGQEHKGGGEPGFVRAIRRVTAAEKKIAYQQTMDHIRSEMSAPARAFSKFIHNVTVERTSVALGSTVARPNAILSGSLSALILLTGLYVTAKIFGYPLSGFETIGAFVIGWIIGIIYDYVRILATGRTN